MFYFKENAFDLIAAIFGLQQSVGRLVAERRNPAAHPVCDVIDAQDFGGSTNHRDFVARVAGGGIGFRIFDDHADCALPAVVRLIDGGVCSTGRYGGISFGCFRGTHALAHNPIIERFGWLRDAWPEHREWACVADQGFRIGQMALRFRRLQWERHETALDYGFGDGCLRAIVGACV